MESALPRYFGSVDHWIRRAAGMPATVDSLFDKRHKEIHRYTIADVNGPLTLTLPIVKPHGIPHATWQDVRISEHGQWWHVHRVSLESAYGRTPFFEFYIDRFLPYISRETVDRFPSVAALNQAVEQEIAGVLLLSPPAYRGELAATPPTPATGSQPASLNRSECRGRSESWGERAPIQTPYWQPRAERFGFLGHLSVLDLIFCIGPEAALWIRQQLSPTITLTNK